MSEDCEILTATEASRAFSEMLHRVCYGGESFLIRKGGRLMARITPVEPVPAPPRAEKSENLKAQVTIESPAEKTPAAAQDESEFYQAWMEQVRKVPLLVD